MTDDLERAGRALAAHPEAVPTSMEELSDRVRSRRNRRKWQRAGGAALALALIVGSVAVLRDNDDEQAIVADGPELAEGPCLPTGGWVNYSPLDAPPTAPVDVPCEVPPALALDDFPAAAIVAVYEEGAPAAVIDLDGVVVGRISDYPDAGGQFMFSVEEGDVTFSPISRNAMLVAPLCGQVVGWFLSGAIVRGQCEPGLDGVWFVAGERHHLLLSDASALVPTRIMLIERGDAEQIGRGPGEREILYSCGLEPYSVAVFDGEAIAEQGDDPAATALRGLIEGSADASLAADGWRRLYDSGDIVVFGHGDPRDGNLDEETFVRAGDGFEHVGSKRGCQPLAATPGRNLVEFRVADNATLGQDIAVVLTEKACTSGSPLDGRVDEPRVIYEADAVSVLYAARPSDGDTLGCPQKPVYLTTLHLTEPLGDRELRDLSVYPAEVEIVGFVGSTGGATGLLGPDGKAVTMEWIQAQETWSQLGIDDYTYDIELSGYAVHVTVVDGAVASATPGPGTRAGTVQPSQFVVPIEGYFQWLICDCHGSVTYDEHGIPVEVAMDELRWSITNFEPTP